MGAPINDLNEETPFHSYPVMLGVVVAGLHFPKNFPTSVYCQKMAENNESGLVSMNGNDPKYYFHIYHIGLSELKVCGGIFPFSLI